MHRNNGWWYDRHRPRYHPIVDHAQAARANPERYRLTPAETAVVQFLNRERLIKAVASHGFIRIRHTTDNLGWQFWGYPDTALLVLLRFLRKHEVGKHLQVTFTDLAPRKPVTVQDQAWRFQLFGRDHSALPPLAALIGRWERRDVAVR